jgi:hypothetical protein
MGLVNHRDADADMGDCISAIILLIVELKIED